MKTRKATARGRPRSDLARKAILRAAYEILREGGFAAFTVEGVAKRAGAGKATIYRWWNSKGTLAIESFLEAIAPRMDVLRPSPSAVADLRKQVHVAASIYRSRAGQLMRELVALGQQDSETGKRLRSDFIEPRRHAAMATLRRAVDSGELHASVDIEVLADALWGPILHRLLVSQMTFDRRFIDHLLDLVLAGAAVKR
jgi:AcrR family transcriptional regulator